ncbi:unnamed protein product [Cladocopium goreaui]|uniref:Uncharacterized protein n=1 Tax=Cladocopium goreaui TaxID=2562237 RepID=A0A9P1CRJ4_9DINO|nr:unnamed protein product [Cladocopium goreaui]
MKRVFTPRADGSYIVPKEFVEKWKDLKTRTEVELLFEKCDYCTDSFVRKCRRITEELDESIMDVEHQFLTVEDMEGLSYSQSKIDGIKEYCKQDPSLTRNSKYGGGLMYWVEVAVKGNERSIRRNLLKKEIEFEEEAESKDDLPRLNTALPLPVALKGTWAYGAELSDVESLPQTNPVNQDVLKALRQTGFPDVEAKASAMSLATKVGGNIQKRLNKLDEAWNKIQAIPASERTSLMTKMMEKIGLIKDDLFKKSEALNELYSSCLLEGATEQNESEMKQVILAARKLAVDSILLEPRVKPSAYKQLLFTV